MRHFVSPFLVCVLLSTGCASSVNQSMQRWVGHNVQELTKSWGAPTEVRDNQPGGGTIVIYDFHSRVGLAGGPPDTSQSGPMETIDRERVRVFYVNGDGMITSWSWQGR